jgi:hypothetical protein
MATTTMTEDKGIANNMSTSRLRLGELGSEGMAAIRDITNYLQPLELRWPTCLKTYEKMKLDSTVSAALDLGYILIEKLAMLRAYYNNLLRHLSKYYFRVVILVTMHLL